MPLPAVVSPSGFPEPSPLQNACSCSAPSRLPICWARKSSSETGLVGPELLRDRDLGRRVEGGHRLLADRVVDGYIAAGLGEPGRAAQGGVERDVEGLPVGGQELLCEPATVEAAREAAITFAASRGNSVSGANRSSMNRWSQRSAARSERSGSVFASNSQSSAHQRATAHPSRVQPNSACRAGSPWSFG